MATKTPNPTRGDAAMSAPDHHTTTWTWTLVELAVAVLLVILTALLVVSGGWSAR
jgi:hypothetical protein